MAALPHPHGSNRHSVRRFEDRAGDTVERVRSTFRRVDPGRYPELAAYSRDDIYGGGDNMAPGGLYLAALMTRSLHLKPGDVVLDLGCGRGDSSIFLARHFGVRVVSVDLWISAAERRRKFSERGYAQVITPLQLDARIDLPFGENHFDAIFCMQAFHSFGGSVPFLRRLLAHLKPGGRLGIGTTCFNAAVTGETLPEVYRQTDGWDPEYEKYNWPAWWRALFEDSGLVDVIECDELDDGRVFWEDDILYRGDKAEWNDAFLREARWLIDQIVYGQSHRLYLTHLAATFERR